MKTNKSIVCIDHTDGKLHFAWPFFARLMKENVDISIISLNNESFKVFQQQFPQLKINVEHSINLHDLKIIFVDQISKIESLALDSLYYPVIPKSESNSFPDVENVLVPSFELQGICQPSVEDVWDVLKRKSILTDFAGRKILISAGPTAEDIDPVRFITNRSTGKMGNALARAAYQRGADVKLVIGPTCQETPSYLTPVFVRSAAEMATSISSLFTDCHIFISSAAVADYTPAHAYSEKLKKSDGNFILDLHRTVDILQEVRKKKRSGQLVVGFSVETQNLLENSLAKLHRKGLDMIVANNPVEKGAAFATDTNKVSILKTTGEKIVLPLLSKLETAHKILDEIKTLL